jgi:hypothetical protein
MIHLLDIATLLFQAFLLRGYSDVARRLIAAQISNGARPRLEIRPDRIVMQHQYLDGNRVAK